MSLATLKKQQGDLNADEIFELNTILDSQQSIIQKKLRRKASGNSSIPISDDIPGFVLFTSNLSAEMNSFVRKEVLKLQLRTTKQIILLLELKETDFRTATKFFLPSGLSDYLFG